MTETQEVLTLLRAKQSSLDNAIAEAARGYLKYLGRRPNADYDLRVSATELRNLAKGAGVCYDRPSTGLAYALWYHARRVNTILPFVLDPVREMCGRSLRVYDLGAGTGAAQWALALACNSVIEQGRTPPRLEVINVDSSPFMLECLEYLWQRLASCLPGCEYISHTSSLNTWHESTKGGEQDCWLFASYLFDYRDKRESLEEDFRALIERLLPQYTFISTSSQSKKVAFLEAIAAQLESGGYLSRDPPSPAPFEGLLYRVNEVRAELQKTMACMNPQASWDDFSFEGRLYSRRQASLNVSDLLPSARNNVGALFTPRITERLAVESSPEQKRAARPDSRPTLIHGPAGCGKSVVITERVANVVEGADYDPNLRILVTTFNRSLIEELMYPWIWELLGNQSVTWRPAKNEVGETCYLCTFEGSKKPNIYLLHFDVLPTRLGKVQRLEDREQLATEQMLLDVAERAIAKSEEELKEEGFSARQRARMRDPAFLIDEYHRVVYGLGHLTQERFMEESRPGRPRFQKNSKPRKALWKAMEVFRHELKAGERPYTTFSERRWRFLRLLDPDRNVFAEILRRNAGKTDDSDLLVRREIDRIRKYDKVDCLLPNEYVGYFTHVFVDEMQDCTGTDYEIFYKLLKSPNELVVSGDLAQAVHMGRSASSILPRARCPEQRNRHTHELQGSYRLPFRVSEALYPLSHRILTKREACRDRVSVSLQNPYRGSRPGARPVVVWAESDQEMAEKIEAVYKAYSANSKRVGFELGTCSILERDSTLRRALSARGLVAETSTILKLKGLEKTFVVWSTRSYADTDDDVEEYVYTILTRTAALLVIALFSEVQPSFLPILSTIEKERVILWDEETERSFEELKADYPLDDDYEPHADESE